MSFTFRICECMIWILCPQANIIPSRLAETWKSFCKSIQHGIFYFQMKWQMNVFFALLSRHSLFSCILIAWNGCIREHSTSHQRCTLFCNKNIASHSHHFIWFYWNMPGNINHCVTMQYCISSQWLLSVVGFFPLWSDAVLVHVPSNSSIYISFLRVNLLLFTFQD